MSTHPTQQVVWTITYILEHKLLSTPKQARNVGHQGSLSAVTTARGCRQVTSIAACWNSCGEARLAVPHGLASAPTTTYEQPTHGQSGNICVRSNVIIVWPIELDDGMVVAKMENPC